MIGYRDPESCQQESKAPARDRFAAVRVMEIVHGHSFSSNGEEFLHCVYWDGIWTFEFRGLFGFWFWGFVKLGCFNCLDQLLSWWKLIFILVASL